MQQWSVPHFSRELLTTSWVFFFFFVCQLVVIGSFASSPSPAPPCTLILPLPLIQPRQIFWCLPVGQISGSVCWDSWLFFLIDLFLFFLLSVFLNTCQAQTIIGHDQTFFFQFHFNVFQTSKKKKSSSKQVQVDTAPQANRESRSKTKCFQWPKVSSSPVLLVSCSPPIPSFLYLFCYSFIHLCIYLFAPTTST